MTWPEGYYLYGALYVHPESGYDGYLRAWPFEDWDRIMSREFLLLNGFPVPTTEER